MVPETRLIPVITGTTASGKTALALELARRRPEFEVVNADSLLVYRGLDIGTAKPTAMELAAVPHHLVDIREPDEPFTAGDFVRESGRAIQDIESRGKRALFVGGSGFYLKALLYGLWDAPSSDPALRRRIEAKSDVELYDELMKLDEPAALAIGRNDRYRLIRAMEMIAQTGKTPSQLKAEASKSPDPRYRLLVLDRENDELFTRIHARTQAMLEAGLVEETARIHSSHPQARSLGAVGYAQVMASLAGSPPAGRKLKPGTEGLREEIELATRQLVKRQRTWFRAEKSATWFILDRERAALEKLLESL